MTSWNRIALVFPLLVATACATQRPTTSVADPAERDVIAREQRLTYALANGRLAEIDTILARDFRCAVAGSDWFTFERETARGLACTGVGGSSTSHNRSEWQTASENRVPRSAAIDSIDVTVNGSTAKAVSTQTLSYWWPYAGPTPHRFRLTDTWSFADGEWRLVRRYSEPLADRERIARVSTRP